MTQVIFDEWMTTLDRSMRSQNRGILLFLDNFSGHGVSHLMLTNVTVKFFPPNTTSMLQPLDQGIINCFKRHYRDKLVQNIVDHLECGAVPPDVSIQDAIYMTDHAWKSIAPVSISNCFAHCGFKFADQVFQESLTTTVSQEGLSPTDDSAWQQYLTLTNASSPFHDFDHYVAIDSAALSHEMLSDQELIDRVLAPEPKAEEEDSQEQPPAPAMPNIVAVRDAFSLIKHFYMAQNSDTSEYLSLIARAECGIDKFTVTKQTKISDSSFW